MVIIKSSNFTTNGSFIVIMVFRGILYSQLLSSQLTSYHQLQGAREFSINHFKGQQDVDHSIKTPELGA